jgi:Protein of unknown function (DUF3789)
MHEFLFFIIGILLGGLISVVLMSLLQINRISRREVDVYEKKKGSDSFPSGR